MSRSDSNGSDGGSDIVDFPMTPCDVDDEDDVSSLHSKVESSVPRSTTAMSWANDPSRHPLAAAASDETRRRRTQIKLRTHLPALAHYLHMGVHGKVATDTPASRDMQGPVVDKKAPVSVRKIAVNDRRENRAKCKETKAVARNIIRTAKYTKLNFFPKNLAEQLQRVANFFFLFLVILMLIPMIPNSLPWYTMAVTLVIILSISMVKDGYADYKRHVADKNVNMSKSLTLKEDNWKTIYWQDIEIGDIVLVKNDEKIPADIVLLSTSGDGREAFIETADLDGETNLKQRQALEATNEIGDSAQEAKKMIGLLQCDLPNTTLESFKGSLKLKSNNDELPIKNSNVILRGCILRNTNYVVGLVVYAGEETKVMKNTGVTKFKRTHVDLRLDKLVIAMCVMLVTFASVCAIFIRLWRSFSGEDFRRSFNDFTSDEDDFFKGDDHIAFLHFWSYFILLNTLIPISLYVSVEIIRLGQSKMIDWDDDMVDPETGTRAMARSTSLNEELGQIGYIFSDKTGTLTRNVMTFRQCSIDGEIFGIDVSADKAVQEVTERAFLKICLDFFANHFTIHCMKEKMNTARISSEF
eukprot:m.288356 g.288356  ORF g.288356 m.288356 type:complete len:583 (-) comp16370_c1_seq1:680-2428(-)